VATPTPAKSQEASKPKVSMVFKQAGCSFNSSEALFNILQEILRFPDKANATRMKAFNLIIL
jgi:hypothetical protein